MAFTKIAAAGIASTGTVTLQNVAVSGIVTATSLLLNNQTLTGTASQPLQVTGGAYVSGSVGIGTTNPGSTLDVRSSTGTIRAQENTDNYSVLLNPAPGSGPRLSLGQNGSNTFMEMGAYGSGINNLDTKNRDLKIFSTAAPDAFILRQATGNIGIGTTNPTSKLHVVGSGTTTLLVQGNARITGILTVGTGSISLNGTTSTISGVSSVTDDTGGYLSIPPGSVQFFAMNTAPNGWIKANGATISRSAYAALFAALGTTFGAGDGSTTFVIPDMRGEFPRGWDDGRGIDSGRAFGTAQASTRVLNAVGTASGSLSQTSFAGFRFHADSFGLQNADDSSDTTTDQNTTAAGTGGSSQNSRNYYRAIRPRNIALLACIKY